MDNEVYTEHRRTLRDQWLEKKAAADKLYHDAAMAGIGFEVAMVTAFGAPHVMSAASHAVTVVVLVFVIPVYRKILQLDTEFLEKEMKWLDLQQSVDNAKDGLGVARIQRELDKAKAECDAQVKKAKPWDAAYKWLFHIGLISFALSALVTMYFVSNQGK